MDEATGWTANLDDLMARIAHRFGRVEQLFELLGARIDEDRQPWPVIRRKVRFVGVTNRTKTSPNTYRWQQHAAWTRQLPSRAVVNVSLQPQGLVELPASRLRWRPANGPPRRRRTCSARTAPCPESTSRSVPPTCLDRRGRHAPRRRVASRAGPRSSRRY